MKAVAKEEGVKALIWTVGEAGIDLAWAEADIVLLTPQVRHLKAQLEARKDHRVPVATISDVDFGKMNAEKIFHDALEIIQSNQEASE